MKYIVTNDEYTNLSDELKSEYEQSDGQYRLKVEGEIPEVKAANDRVVEFRNNNIGLLKKVDDYEAKLKTFEGVDANEYRTLKAKVQEFERSGAKDPQDIEERLQAAVKNAVEPLQKQMAEIQRQKDESELALKRKDVEGSFAELARKLNVRKSAVSDFIHRGMQVFDLDGKAMDGDRPRFSKKNPALELTMDEWATELTQEAPHLFEESKGGGAGGNGSGGQQTASRVIGTDPIAFGNNLEDIAKGKTLVTRENN